MFRYLLQRMFFIPATLLLVLAINFILISLAPGDPSLVAQVGGAEEGTREAESLASKGVSSPYRLFREHYGLTLPILLNLWPHRKLQEVEEDLSLFVHKGMDGEGRRLISSREYAKLKVELGDRARYILPQLLTLLGDRSKSLDLREAALRFFIYGATRLGYVGLTLSETERQANQEIQRENDLLQQLLPLRGEVVTSDFLNQRSLHVEEWFTAHQEECKKGGVKCLLFETRMMRYLSRILQFDFGRMRNDPQKLVIREVGKRLKVSLSLAVLPLMVSFGLALVCGMFMALCRGRWPDHLLHFLLLILYAAPIFVVVPFLIDKVALHGSLPLSLPSSGLHSDGFALSQMRSWDQVKDLLLHLCLPFIAVTYGLLASHARLARTAFLDVLRLDHVRAARAKGSSPWTLLTRHIGRCAAIPLVTVLASSLGVILSGSLIIETLFGIDGFGHFFYEAILNRDYNVILFSALAGSSVAMVGYLLADFAYVLLDPRVVLR